MIVHKKYKLDFVKRLIFVQLLIFFISVGTTFFLTRYYYTNFYEDLTFKILPTAVLILVAISFLLILLVFISIKIAFMQKSAEKRMTAKLKEDLVANISHEVKTPLTAIMGYIQILKAKKHLVDSEIQVALDKIFRNVDRLNSLFRDVLELARLENSGKLSLEIVPLKDIVDHVTHSVSLCYANKNIAISSDIRIDFVEIDPKIFEQVLTNLLDNACKYNRDNGMVQIVCELLDEDKFQLTIVDSGIGIDKKFINRVFERFFRVDTSRSREMGGSGLGLAIVKHAVGHHGGEIFIDSTLGKGTTFRVLFPLPFKK